jgi:hypothetical protein
MIMATSKKNIQVLAKSTLKIFTILLLMSPSKTAFAQLPFFPGILANGNQTICYGGDPNTISFAFSPSVSVSYQWYYRNGIVGVPVVTASTSGWTIISGATASSYNPPAGLTGSRTYACRVRSGVNNLWASGVRQITVLGPLTNGVIASGNQTFNLSGNPNPISLSFNPSGGTGVFTYQWYSRLGIHSAPTGTGIPSGWTAIPGANSSSYDPPLQYQSITYALRVDPQGTPDCSGPRWSSFERKITINFNPGTLALGNQTLCAPADPANISFSTAATAGVSYQWYYQNGIHSAPAATASTLGWTLIFGATGSSYNPPAGLESNRTYACRVINGPVSLWANGVRQIYVPVFDSGIVLLSGVPDDLPQNELLYFLSGNPGPIECLTPYTSGYSYQWYSFSGISSRPDVSSVPAGWLAISGANSSIYDPPLLTASRTYACRVTYNGCSRWAEEELKVIVSNANFGQLAGDLIDTVCYEGDPDPITFSNPPANGATINWYRTTWLKNPSSPLTPEDVLVGTGLTYDPSPVFDDGSFTPMNRFYTPRVTIGTVSYWLEPRYIVARSRFSPGEVFGSQALCFPASPSSAITIGKPRGASTPYYLCQWFATDGNYPDGILSCDEYGFVSGLSWQAVGSSFIINRTSETDDFLNTTLPAGLPIITAPPVQHPDGDLNVLTYRLHVVPVKSPVSLEPVLCYNGQIPACPSIIGTELFAEGHHQVLVWQCAIGARYAADEIHSKTNAKTSSFLGNAYPNPARDVVTIDYELPEQTSQAIIALYDMNGRKVLQTQLHSVSGLNQVKLPVNDLQSGLFVYTLEIDGVKYHSKIISVAH